MQGGAPEGIERRRYPRREFSTAVLVYVDNREVPGTLVNISIGGALVHVEIQLDKFGSGSDTEEELAPDSWVKVSIPKLALSSTRSRIIRSRSGDRGLYLAMEFENIRPELSYRLIEQLLRKRR